MKRLAFVFLVTMSVGAQAQHKAQPSIFSANPSTWIEHGAVTFGTGVSGWAISQAVDVRALPVILSVAAWGFYIVRELQENGARIKRGTMDPESWIDSIGDAFIGPGIGFLLTVLLL